MNRPATTEQIEQEQTMTEGVLYIAKGTEFVEEACISATQLANVMPEVPIALITDTSIESDVFDEVILDESPYSKLDKPRNLPNSPFDKTIFLDSDTYVTSDISELFDMLDAFDLLVVRDACEYNLRDATHPVDGVPEGFPELYAGVLAYTDSSSVTELCSLWEEYHSAEYERDQRSFRPALYHSDVRYATLPSRYNCMYRYRGEINGPVKVFHGQLKDDLRTSSGSNYYDITVDEADEIINATSGHRIYYRYRNQLFVAPPPPFPRRVLEILRENGVLGTVKERLQFR